MMNPKARGRDDLVWSSSVSLLGTAQHDFWVVAPNFGTHMGTAAAAPDPGGQP